MPLQIIRQDITKMQVDAIVNTTNSQLIGYSGVDLAVHTLAGDELDAECAELAPLDLGQAKITGAYKLPCKYIIHTSGPVWRGGACGERDLLRSCYVESLKLAVEKGCETVAFPLISSGVYQFPKDSALKFAMGVITEFLFEHELTVYLCVYDRESYSFSRRLFNDIKAFVDDGYVEDHGEDYYLDRSRRCESIEPMPPFSCSSSALPVRSRSQKTIKSVTADASRSLEEYMKQIDKSFGEMLISLIDERGMSDVECYKKANVDKRIFSKIRSNKDYKPSKQTALAFAISLKLDLDTTQALLATAGLTLSTSSVFDKIVMYFILNKKYNIHEINEALFVFGQDNLGSI